MHGTRIAVPVYLPNVNDLDPPAMSLAGADATVYQRYQGQLACATAVVFRVTGPAAVDSTMAGVIAMTARLPARAAATAPGRFQGKRAPPDAFIAPIS